MADSIYAHVRVDEAAITDSDRGFIKNREIEVREETPSHENVAAVVTIEGLVDESVPITSSKKSSEQFIPLLKHRRTQFVILPNPVLGGIKFLEKERMGGIIYPA